jgi:hypothetical protein
MVKSNIKELEWKMTVSGKNTDVLEELNPPLQPYQMTMLLLTNNNYRQLTVALQSPTLTKLLALKHMRIYPS